MIHAPLRDGLKITQGFGGNYKTYKRFGLKGHNGQDIACKVGTPLKSPIDGVVEVKDSGKNGYGLHIFITEEGKLERRQIVLGHLSEVFVKTGDVVKLGEPIGKTGNSGFSTGPHLHWGVRRLNIFGFVKNKNNGYLGYEDIFERGWIGTLIPTKY